ncbi:MAG: glycosyltransferase [Burkholderiales bacterium]|nr:glycosyltransferase [Burkholderiales bacterium]
MISRSAIPDGSVLGLNYSGMHDSAIAIVGPDGAPIFACSLERFSRVKQDGRTPSQMLREIPWSRIEKVAVSTQKNFSFPTNAESQLLKKRLQVGRSQGLKHEKPFYDFLDSIPIEKDFICHQMAHAASAFWGSGFESALCLTYDGGMHNSPWFGGLYKCDRVAGITPLDQFSALHYAKITSLYTFVTALLGFTPNKHEGKLTGLAAYGRPTQACRSLLNQWFDLDFVSIESTLEWISVYGHDQAPAFIVNEARMQTYRNAAKGFSREELAATLQDMAERHVLEILDRANSLGWTHENICLAGGLFANVKINQRVIESGYQKLFVAPPMTDDGTALGAAWHALSRKPEFKDELNTVYWGPSYKTSQIEKALITAGVQFKRISDPADTIADLLVKDQVVAVFQGGMEFGPRALGNRSVLASAAHCGINESLNNRLNRTEFMPFAPVTRSEDAQECYLNIEAVAHSAQFMTVTVNCSEKMMSDCPAVVHVDGTARPQLVSSEGNPLIYGVLTRYAEKTERLALVNTSFNRHEEPIVCSPQDALKGFFESGLDYLYFEGGYLVAFADNCDVASKFLLEKIKAPNFKSVQQVSTISSLWGLMETKLSEQHKHHQSLLFQLKEKDEAFKEQLTELKEKDEAFKKQLTDLKEKDEALQQQLEQLNEKEQMINALVEKKAREKKFVIQTPWLVTRIGEIFRPRLGHLRQYLPRPITALEPIQDFPQGDLKFSIVTPSYGQGKFIARTINSVFDQKYPFIEYFVQDGGSKDETIDQIKFYEGRLAGWASEIDSGQSQAINRGFHKTSGEIMSWLNSDDLLLPGALKIVSRFFLENPDVDVVYGNRLQIDVYDREIGRWILPGHDDSVLPWADYIPQETLFWRREIWEKVGGEIDESFRFAMDWDLLLRFREAGAKFAHIPRFLGAFRIHEQQKTLSEINDVGRREMGRIRERALGFVPKQSQIRRAVTPFLLKHLGVDMLYRIRSRVRK